MEFPDPGSIFRDLFPEALHKADLVVCRAGFGSISELSALSKAAIIIPIPQSHQEDNARWLKEHQAAVVLVQNVLTAETFAQEIQQLLQNKTKLDQLRVNIGKLFPNKAAQQVCQIIQQFSFQGR